MPFQRKRYPANWETFTHSIKHGRAADRCECTGECGLHQANPHVRRCVEVHGQPARYFKGRVILTTAHLCNCDPPCAIGSHVKAMCQRCHLRMDAKAKAARRRQRLATARHILSDLLDELGATLTG
jgi:hypothetical protein